MDQIVGFTGKVLLGVLVAVLVTMAVNGLQALARRYGGKLGERMLQGGFFAAIAVVVTEGLPLLWPALAAWHWLVFGASFAFVWAAMRPGLPSKYYTPGHD